MFSTDVLPYVVRNLAAFIPPYGSVPTHLSPALVRQLTDVDYLNLEESCGLLESLCMDVADMRLSLARGLAFPDEHGGAPCLKDMLAYVERADYPPHWAGAADELAALAQREVNGRQIKNAVRTASSLAASRAVPLCYAHLADTLDAMEEFTAEFAAVGRGNPEE